MDLIIGCMVIALVNLIGLGPNREKLNEHYKKLTFIPWVSVSLWNLMSLAGWVAAIVVAFKYLFS